MATKEEKKKKIAKMLGEHKTAMFVTHDKEGGLVSRPMTTQGTDFDGDYVWFFVSADADVIDEIEANPEVNVAYYTKEKYLSVSGEGTLVDDVEKKKELWYPELKKWFKGKGPEDDYVRLIKIELDTGRYWDMTNADEKGPDEGMVNYYNR